MKPILLFACLVLATPSVSSDPRREIVLLIKGDRYEEAARRAQEVLSDMEDAQEGDSLEAAETIDLLLIARLFAGTRGDPAERALAERALQIKERRLEPADTALAPSLRNLAELLRQDAEYAAAEPLYRRALEILESSLPPDHTDLEQPLRDLGNVLLESDRFEEALPLYERALAIREAAAGPDDHDLVPNLYNLAILHRRMGDYDRAAKLFERARAVAAGAEHPDERRLAMILNGHGALLHETGEWAGARRLYEQVLEIRRRLLGPEHVDVAGAQNNLALVLKAAGDYRDARALLEQALAIREARLDPTHPLVAQSLHNLAGVLEATGERARARSLYERALAILEGKLGTGDLPTATTLQALADLLLHAGEPAAARPLYERALRIWEAKLAPSHPDLALGLVGLAATLGPGPHAEEAERLHLRALEIRERAFGPEHPRVAESLHDLAWLHARRGDIAGAFDLASRAETISRDHLSLTARTLPERQALRYAAVRVSALDLVLSLALEGGNPALTRQAWDAVTRSRALVLDEMAARRRTAARAADPGIAPLVAAVADASRRLAQLTLRGPDPHQPERYRGILVRAQQVKEDAERALAERSAGFRAELESRRVGFDQVAQALPRDAALVAFAVHDRPGKPPATEPVRSYLAFVLGPALDGPRLVPLGPAAEIDARIERWREAVTRPQTAHLALGEALRRSVWDPLARDLAGARRVFVVPDAALNLVNLAALPIDGDRYLVEEDTVLHLLSAERDLLEPPEVSAGRGLLALGGVDFDDARAVVASSDTRTALRGAQTDCPDFRAVRFAPLPGTLREVEAIAELWRSAPAAGAGAAVELLVGAAASEAALKGDAPGKRFLHLATHGFFLGGSCAGELPLTRGIGGLSAAAVEDGGIVLESPLLRAGLALAGFNRRDEVEGGEEDGVLSAEEIAALDLTGVEWAVLSACDTGVGEVLAGEGVLGLRRAFRVAGARTTLMSLWSVEDQSAQEWMSELYRARLLQGLSTADAVRAASRRVLVRRREAGAETHPFFWAAFVAAGDWR